MCQMYVKYYLVIFPNIYNVSNVCQILLSKFSPTFMCQMYVKYYLVIFPSISNVSNVCQILFSNFP